jgi:hypothetical protein
VLGLRDGAEISSFKDVNIDELCVGPGIRVKMWISEVKSANLTKHGVSFYECMNAKGSDGNYAYHLRYFK